MPDLISPVNLAALEAGRIIARQFMWVEATRYDDGSPVSQGFWTGRGGVQTEVYNPDTGLSEMRAFTGTGTLIEVSPFADVANLTVQEIQVSVPPYEVFGVDLLRTYNLRRARIEIYEGYLDVDSRRMLAPAEPQFLGFADDLPEERDENGQRSSVITCVSHTQELTRASTEMRSDASQRLRDPDDTFYQDTSSVGEWGVWWGEKNAKVGVTTQEPNKRFGWGNDDGGWDRVG